MAATEYASGSDVRALARRLIELLHPHLHGIRVEYVFVSKPPIVNGQELAGRARIVSGLNAYLAREDAEYEGEAERFFCIEISIQHWMRFDERQRIALVNHELKHCGWDDELETLKIVPHDIEAFDDDARLFGEWLPQFTNFKNALATPEEERAETMRRIMAGG